jgi:hypothetical protein
MSVVHVRRRIRISQSPKQDDARSHSGIQWHRSHPDEPKPAFSVPVRRSPRSGCGPRNTPAEFTQFLKSEYARWDQLIKLSGVTVE